MLVRLILLLAAIAFVAYLYAELRPDPRRAVPVAWKQAAARDPSVQQALDVRGSMAQLLIDGRADADELLDEVDEVLAQLVELSDLRHRIEDAARTAGTLNAVESTLSQLEADAVAAGRWLAEAHTTLLGTSADGLSGAADAARTELHRHTEELRQAVVARREVDAAAKKTGG